MRPLLYAAVLLTAFASLAFSLSTPLPIGSDLPKQELSLRDVSGQSVNFKSLKKANGLLVMFTCNTCPYVVKNQQRTNEICAYAEKMNMGVVLLNSNAANRNGDDSYAAMQAYAKNQQYKWTYAVDENNEMADAFGASRTPECFLFDKNLKLTYHGAIDNNPGDDAAVTRKHLQLAIDETMAGKTVSMAQTKSVGCGIKRASK